MKRPRKAKKPHRNRSRVRRISVDTTPAFDIKVIPDDPQLPTVGELMGSTPEITRVRHVIRWPASWWQHVKEDLFPVWVKRRWPVQFAEHIWWETTVADKVPETLAELEAALDKLESAEPSADKLLACAQAGWDRSASGALPAGHTAGMKGSGSRLAYENGYSMAAKGEARPA